MIKMSYKVGDIQSLTNFSTIQLQASVNLKHPVNQLVIVGDTDKTSSDLEFITLSEFIKRGFSSGVTFDDMFKTLKKDRYKVEDIIMSYVEYLIDENGQIDPEPLKHPDIRYPTVLREQFNQILNQTYSTITKRKETKNLDFIEYMNSLSEREPFRVNLDVMERYGRWLINNENIVNDNQQRLAVIEESNRVLLQYPTKHSPIFVDKISVVAKPLYENKELTVLDGINVFERAKVSDYVPYIQYNGPHQKYYKVWEGQSDDTKPNYSTVIRDNRALEQNHIYMTLWTGRKDVTKATKDSYKLVIYNLETNTLTFQIPSVIGQEGIATDEEIISRVKEALDITFDAFSTNEINGKFVIYDINYFNDVIFLDYVAADGFINKFLYYNEARHPYPLKSRYEFYFKDEIHNEVSGVTVGTKVTLSQGKVKENLDYKIELPSGAVQKLVVVEDESQVKDDTILLDSSYLYVKINAPSLKEARRFADILDRIVKYYSANQDLIIQWYNMLIPETFEATNIRESDAPDVLRVQRQPGPSIAGTKLGYLKKIAPDVFGDNYARNGCQKKRQPILVDAADVERYTKEGRQVVPYPRDNRTQEEIAAGVQYTPRFYFACNSGQYSYPGIVINKKNQKYVPCCFGDSQITDMSSKYAQYYLGAAKTSKRTTTKLSTNKFADPGRSGELPITITRILKLYDENSGNLLRLGVVISPNSLIHALLTAIKDTNYMSRNKIQRESYARGIRRYVYEHINNDVMRQELYNWDDTEIEDNFLNMEGFFDPALYYRSLEEVFNVNIYVFTRKKENSGKTSGDVIFELPRHKVFHTRIFRPDRQTIVIYKHWGSESDASKIPQCELIVDERASSNKSVVTTSTMIYGDNMNSYIYYSVYSLGHEIMTYTFASNDVQTRINLYNQLQYDFPNATGQLIDGYGKSRGLVLNDMTIYYPPSQPLNIRGTLQEVKADISTVLTKYGQPTHVTKEHNLVDGVWYPLADVEMGFYIPVTPTNQLTEMPLGNNHPMLSSENSPALRFKHMEKTITIMVQLIIWLYQLYSPDRSLPLSSFFDQYSIIGETRYDNFDSNTYDLNNIPEHYFPEAQTIDRALTLVSTVTDGFIVNGKIYLYNIWFNTKLQYRIQRFLNQTSSSTKVEKVLNTLQSINDFRQRSNTIIIIGPENFKEWLMEQQRLQHPFSLVHNKLNIQFQNYTNPYLYYDEPLNRYYIIQNVTGGNKGRALAVAAEWYHTHNNPGPTATPLGDISSIPYVVYGISGVTYHLFVKEDHTNQTSEYIQIIEYGRRDKFNATQGMIADSVGEYAAVLPIY